MTREPGQDLLFESEVVTIGRFRCGPDVPLWDREVRMRDGHNIVFPRTCVRIRHAGHAPVLANVNHVILYNENQVYSRTLVSPLGDHSDWCGAPREVVAEVVSAFQPSIVERPERAFEFIRATTDPRCHVLQRLLLRHLAEDQPVDRLFVEEVYLELLRSVLACAYRMRSGPTRTRRRGTAADHRDIAEAAIQFLATRFEKALSLGDVASAVAASVYHLCRVFRRHVGITIHQYLTRLRLRSALDRVLESRERLTDVAMNLGFSSPGHFTDSFRREFGVSPARFRRYAIGGRMRQLSKIMDVSGLGCR